MRQKCSDIQALEIQIQSFDDQIDQEVYRLYCLNDEEIKIVE
jgi:hypothetical protein